MSRIATIDTAIDQKYIRYKDVEHINLCGECSDNNEHSVSHGTICAMVLDYCASDYELVNIQIFKENKTKVFGEIELLAKALKLCCELNVDVVSLSAVSSILSDSKYLYDITYALAKNAVIVSALDNMRYITVPTSYPHVLGVRCDAKRLLSPGEIAYRKDDPFCANIYANCDFELLHEQGCGQSNSFAVPVVAAYVNGLVNQGVPIQEIDSILRSQKSYSVSISQEGFSPYAGSVEREIPIVFFEDDNIEACRLLMDMLYEKHEVQTAMLTLVNGIYDVRIKKGSDIANLREDLRFMERHYKTDIIFIVGIKKMLPEIKENIELDISLIHHGDNKMLIEFDNGRELVLKTLIADRLHEILTA